MTHRRRPRRIHRVSAWILSATMLCSACLPPRVQPLRGTPSAEPLPVAGLPAHAQQWRFRWQYADRVFSVAGDGVVRSLPPDSARLDFFLADGSAGGVAWLLGDTLSGGDGALVPELLPSVPLLWAALGRLVIPASPRQTVHRQGDTLFAEIPAERFVVGTPGGARSVWRLTVVPDAFLRLEELIDHRVIASVERARASTGQWVVHYVATRARRRLRLDIQDTFSVERFDDAIWRRP